jgi:ribosomal protein S18 acetylase RimI-like enzyme
MNTDMSTIERIDRYLHAVPLSGANPHEIGPFTLFRSNTVASYYARPRPGAGVERPAIALSDLDHLRDRCLAFGVPLELEWLVETAPELAAVATAAGLTVVEHPLLVVRSEAFVPAPLRPEVTVRIVEPDPHTLAAARAVMDVAFSHPGTEVGPAGLVARDDRIPLVPAGRVSVQVERARAGLTITAVAVGPDGEPVASGHHQPVGVTSEVVGVATLPAFRRQGLAAAVTSALVEHAFAGGRDLVLLTAQDDAVARVYERLGFSRIGTAGAAE